MACVATYPVTEIVHTLLGRSDLAPPLGVYASLGRAAGRAWQGHALLGLPTPFGLHEPGPALAYLASPVVAALGKPRLAAVSVAALAVTGTALVGAVAVLWRRLGPAAALAVSLLAEVWMLGLGLGPLRTPAPGLVVVAPSFLLLVLCALAVTGAPGAWLWAAVVASVVAQAHLPAAPFAVGTSILAGLWALWSASGEERLELPDQWWRSPARSLGWVALVSVWVPPAVQALGSGTDNLASLLAYLRQGHPVLGAAGGARAGVAAVALPLLGGGTPGGPLEHGAVETLVAGAVLALSVVAVAVVAKRRRSALSYRLVALSGFAALLGGGSLALSPEQITLPVAAWMAALPLALATALCIALLGPLGPPSTRPTGLKALGAAAKKKLAAHHPPTPRPGAELTRHRHQPPADPTAKQTAGAAGGKATAKVPAAATPARERRHLLGYPAVRPVVLAPLAALALVAAGITAGAGVDLRPLDARPPVVRPLPDASLSRQHR